MTTKTSKTEIVTIRVNGKLVKCSSTPSGIVTALDGTELSPKDIGKVNVKAALKFAAR